MRRLLIAVASTLLLAATPSDVISDLEANGYYIEPGSNATEEVVSDAVFTGRADGGRLYLVVLAEEPPGGATTFSDSVLDRLEDGYVVTVAPETVGFAGDGSHWTVGEMDSAVEASLDGSSDDEVVELFVRELTGEGTPPPPGGEGSDLDGGGMSAWVWFALIGVGLAVLLFARRSAGRGAARAGAELEKVKARAREKLAEVANDIIEMEDEVELSESPEVKGHYQRASATYTAALAAVESSPTPEEMLDIVRQLDLAIWELDAAEAILDGRPVPAKPKPPEAKQPTPEPTPSRDVEGERDEGPPPRRSQRQSSYVGDDLMTALWAILAMTGRGHGGWGGIPGGFGGPMGRGSGGPRMRGGGFRGGGAGRMRGGGRRR